MEGEGEKEFEGEGLGEGFPTSKKKNIIIPGGAFYVAMQRKIAATFKNTIAINFAGQQAGMFGASGKDVGIGELTEGRKIYLLKKFQK